MRPTVLTGGRLHCMDEHRTRADAIAYADGKILAVGDRVAVVEAAGPEATLHDLGGATVLPGFVDAHHHVSISALYGGLVRLTPPGVTDIPSLQAALAEAARGLAPGRWVVAMEWDEGLLAERRPPTRSELDEAVGDRPLFALHQTCHRALANSRALELAGIGRHTPNPAGGTISRCATGLPDGLLIERGMSRVESLARPDLAAHDAEGFLARMAEHYRALVAVGITRVADTAAPADLLTLYRASASRGEVLVPTLICPVSTTGYLEEPWDVLDGPVTGEQDGPLRIGPVKLVFDGAPGCSMCLGWWQTFGALVRTAALSLRLGSFDPLRTSMSIVPRYGRQVRSGVAIYQAAEAERMVRGLLERGFGVATHAIGNAAVEVAVGAYEAAGAGVHASGAPRIEHGAFASRALVERIAGVGAGVAVQPAFLAMPSMSGVVRVSGLPIFPLRWMLDAGITVAGSSDYPVAGFDPLEGIRRAVSRQNARGEVVDEEQRISVEEAVHLYTAGGAALCGSLNESGTLEVGKRADLVVLGGGLDALEEASVRATVIGGEIVYGQLGG